MTVLPIVTAPDPRLKIKSEPVEKITPEIQRFMDDMLETMYATGGIGLAAVQVGVHKRILVMDVDHGSSRYPDSQKGEHNPLFLINPEIVSESEEKNTYDEGCLSFPGQYAEVVRPKRVKVKYLDYNGKPQELEADELLATCVQHEIDHLNGVVFVDHISTLKRDIIMRKLKKKKKHES
ncbi:MAG: peptide deformylase [Proteobacteria bacterium]|nr:peptide deformylase [Pseudomonadota bacterium]